MQSPVNLTMWIDGKPLSMEVDTGYMSLISEATFRVHFPQGSLKPSRARLVTYSKENLATLGQMEVLVIYEEQQAVIPVVAGSGPSLLSRNWLGKIRLDCKAINMVRDTNTALADLLDHHRGEVYLLMSWGNWTLTKCTIYVHETLVS